MTCTENAETLTGQDEPVKTCPECGSDNTRQVYEYANGEKVCAADQCDSCGHQWNVG